MANNKTHEQIMAAAGLPAAAGAMWRSRWAESEKTFAGADQPCLRPAWINQICRDLEWPEDIRAALLAGLSLFQEHPALTRLLWHCRFLLFDAPGAGVESELKKWPMLPATLHPASDLFYAYLFLAGLPSALAQYAQLGVPAEIGRVTFADLPVWMADYKQKHGRWGLDELHRTGWLYGHLRAKLFRLGRLQFRFESFKYAYRVYQKRDGSQTVMLAGANEKIRPDGRFDGANGIYAGADAWTTIFDENAAGVTGNPVDARGLARRERVILSRRDWQPVLMPDDPILGIHIPAGAPLTPDVCDAALRQAAVFFPKYFPDCAAKVFTCVTWLFDPQFGQYLPPDANIVRFQRKFYLFPVPNADDRQTLERVCGRVYNSPSNMPRTTSLQRVVADHMSRGGRWYLTGGFMLMNANDFPGNAHAENQRGTVNREP